MSNPMQVGHQPKINQELYEINQINLEEFSEKTTDYAIYVKNNRSAYMMDENEFDSYQIRLRKKEEEKAARGIIGSVYHGAFDFIENVAPMHWKPTVMLMRGDLQDYKFHALIALTTLVTSVALIVFFCPKVGPSPPSQSLHLAVEPFVTQNLSTI